MARLSARFIALCVSILLFYSVFFYLFISMENIRIPVTGFAAGLAALIILFLSRPRQSPLFERVLLSGIFIGFFLAGLIYVGLTN